MVNEIEEILNKIQYKTGQSLDEIAKKIGYSRPYLNNVKLKGGGKKVIGILKLKYAEILQNVSNNGAGDIVQGKDLSKVIGKIHAWQAGVDAALSVLISEITPLIAKQTGKSHAAVFSQMKKDIEDETKNQIALLNKK